MQNLAFITSFTANDKMIEQFMIAITSYDKTNTTKIDWWVATDLPDKVKWHFKDYKFNNVTLKVKGFEAHDNLTFDNLLGNEINDPYIKCDIWSYFSGCSNKYLTAKKIIKSYSMIAYIDTDVLFMKDISENLNEFKEAEYDLICNNEKHYVVKHGIAKIDNGLNAGVVFIKQNEKTISFFENYEEHINNLKCKYISKVYDEIVFHECNLNISYNETFICTLSYKVEYYDFKNFAIVHYHAPLFISEDDMQDTENVVQNFSYIFNRVDELKLIIYLLANYDLKVFKKNLENTLKIIINFCYPIPKTTIGYLTDKEQQIFDKYHKPTLSYACKIATEYNKNYSA